MNSTCSLNGAGTCECAVGADVTLNSSLVDGHQWTASVGSTRTIDPIAGAVDEGSPRPTYCTVETKDRVNGAVQVLGGIPAPSENVMSYYGADCGGPYVIDGYRYEGFTDDQLQRILLARQLVPPRNQLPDVCDERGHDTDHDGICDDDDTCKLVKDTCQKDSDGDGIGDACDTCPDDAVVTGDLDGDGEGDFCDEDADGDGCFGDDEDPFHASVSIGTKLTPTCEVHASTVYEFEGNDTDSDGLLNCQDPDNDDDGICDGPNIVLWNGGYCLPGPDPCPNSATDDCETIVGGSQVDCPPAWRVCQGSDCFELFVKIFQAVNPDPTRTLIFDRFQIHHDALYLSRQPERTLSESARAIEALADQSIAGLAGARSLTTTAQKVRVEIWSRRTGQMVAVVGEFASEDLEVGDVRRGKLLILDPELDRDGHARLRLRTSFAPAVDADDVEPDRDGDRRPDTADNCLRTANPLQADGDRDGIGNACDADLDGDHRVTQNDVDAVRGCEGADLRLQSPIEEPALDDESFDEQPADTLDPFLIELARRCKEADLDDSGVVDQTDTEIATRMLGQLEGMSALRRFGAGCVQAESAHVVARIRRGNASFSGKAVIAQPWQAIDPMTNGVGVFVEGIVEGVVPPGALSDGTGWKVNRAGTKWIYTDPNGTHAGIYRVVIQDQSGEVAGRVRWKVDAKLTADLIPGPRAVDAAILLGGPGECASVAFQSRRAEAPFCKAGPAKLACK
jgi:hypothetical protein